MDSYLAQTRLWGTPKSRACPTLRNLNVPGSRPCRGRMRANVRCPTPGRHRHRPDRRDRDRGRCPQPDRPRRCRRPECAGIGVAGRVDGADRRADRRAVAGGRGRRAGHPRRDRRAGDRHSRPARRGHRRAGAPHPRRAAGRAARTLRDRTIRPRSRPRTTRRCVLSDCWSRARTSLRSSSSCSVAWSSASTTTTRSGWSS